jgi:hypothetical protein
MKMTLRISCASLALLVLGTITPAAAKDCKNEAVTATSGEYLSRSLGAFPGSWAAWRKEVKDKVGDGWQAWRRAEERNISCDQNSANRRWTCTRSAKPCRPGSGEPQPPIVDYPPIDKILRRGMKDEQVKTLQYLLNEAGYQVEIDGNFGRGTEKLLRDFQKKSGITVDGRAGPKTVEALTS